MARFLPDVVAVAALALLIAGYAAAFLDRTPVPEEDAAMVLRYSEHVAERHGIVWNLGEPPVDGATDFLFMLGVARTAAAGVPLERAAKAVGLVAHVLGVLLVYSAARRWAHAPAVVALVPAAYMAVGPGLHYVAASYGTTLFAATVALAWWLACGSMAASDAAVAKWAAGLGLAGVLMGVARPEGAFLAVFFLAAVLVARRGRPVGRILLFFALAFGVLGLAYFAWRWAYFGHPLPNPFYRRGGGLLHLDVLARSARNVLRLGGPFLLVPLAGLLFRESRRLSTAVILPVVLFGSLWVLVSDEANYYMRYRYPILPVILVGAVLVGARLAVPLATRPAPVPATAVVVGALSLAAVLVADQHWQLRRIQPRTSGLGTVGRRLGPFAARGYTLVTTEAGLLPLYSRWRAVDAWGLNDAWIAHEGLVSAGYLDRYRPEVVMFHAYFSPESAEDRAQGARRGLGPAWSETVRRLQSYAIERDYQLAVVYARSPHESHYYYVRRGLPDTSALVAAVRVGRYDWDGEPADDVTAETCDPPGTCAR